ncbi:hypothetical protein HZS_4827 [Henneguya salminicola]|nr:hypothetical protein HZS_4827 [Henneguya salminicola]
MDNCSFYHRSDVTALFIELGVSVRFLPPYFPQLNPIEEYFSHLKSVYSSEPRPRNNCELKEKNFKNT